MSKIEFGGRITASVSSDHLSEIHALVSGLNVENIGLEMKFVPTPGSGTLDPIEVLKQLKKPLHEATITITIK